MTDFFEFEADFVESLRCIPMQVRYKLDTCGIKLKLDHWHAFSQTERQAIVAQPCTTPTQIQECHSLIQNLVQHHTGSPAAELPVEAEPAWLQTAEVPEALLTKAQAAGVAIAPEQWAGLTPLQRFALLKLSRPSHESRNFVPALQEFHLA